MARRVVDRTIDSREARRKLKARNLINSLREVEHEMTAMNPVVKALLR
jgi:hypothetical protein